MGVHSLAKYTMIVLFLVSESCAKQETRYTVTTQPSGDIVLHPVPIADLDGDGDSGDADDFAIFQKERTAPGVTTKPTTQPEVPPIIDPTPCIASLALTPDMDWQAAVTAARPGTTVCFRGGDYRKPSGGQNYEATLSVNCSGEPGKPITIRNVPGEKVTFYGDNQFYAIVVGYIRYNGDKFGVHDVIVDGLEATHSPWNGIKIVSSNNVTLRNCSAYANNYNNDFAYKAGIDVDNSNNVTIEWCRAWDNGIGISVGAEQAGVAEPKSVTGIVVKDCFIYANSRAGNYGNAEGLELWFCDGALIQGCVLWDNPDANINGQGNTRCRYLNNICLNSWQDGGNNEGFKACVRGGGGNVIAGNIFANNANCGFDAASGVGDLLVGNTLCQNGSWGILAEGRETILFNNLVVGNSIRGGNTYIEQDATGWSLISDWNRYGSGPLKSTQNDTLTQLPPNTKISPIPLSGFSLPRSDPRQVIHPEQAFGTSDISRARAKIQEKYRPQGASIQGLGSSAIQAAVNANIPQIQAALGSAITAADSSPDFQSKQAASRYRLLKSQLTSYDLSGVEDTRVIGAAK